MKRKFIFSPGLVFQPGGSQTKNLGTSPPPGGGARALAEADAEGANATGGAAAFQGGATAAA